MLDTLDTILHDPVWLGVAAVLILLLVVALLLKLLKLAALAALVLVGYVAVLHFTGAEVPREITRVEEKVKTKAVEVGREVVDKAREVGQSETVREIENKVRAIAR
jgi:hypothetical protein